MIAELYRVANPDLMVAQFAGTALAVIGLWGFFRWFINVPVRPDPWDEQTTAEMEKAESPALCHRCLEPHDDKVNFCPHCGAPVGPYTNMLPFEYLFSIGHTLRIGTDGHFKRTPLTVGGFIAFSLTEYNIFAPVYWGELLWKLYRQSPVDPSAEPPLPPTEPAAKES